MKSIFRIAIAVFLALTFLAGCDRVQSGHVGVKVNLLGGNKGVDIEELSPGKHWIGVNEELHVFPTFTQTDNWSKREGYDQSMNFQSNQGLAVNADVGITFRVDPAKVSLIFQKYRKGMGEISDLYLRNMVQDALVRRAGKLDIESLYGEGKSALILGAQEDVTKEVAPLGIIVEKLYWVGNLRLPQSVVASIDAKIAATQKAQQRENEIRQSEAEAAKKVADAKGEAESTLLKAQAQAKANKLLAESISPTLVQYKALETWDGKLPTMTSGAIPFINVSPK